ncbi:MAG: methyl-accepting chemotaxis protein [Tardiphaga sp.]|uniref:methyl-accepting chemotaxis protein n=1 Tax=Tardiphaga sp. TaxID=1926292 RepID=UPI0019AC9CE5|nr:methyl-accepting chemotaxis protein [Tardiphaga sp.]MBC7583238.1 methyl-accepting chemotaxis protein [Tardiphaga sp.]
MNWYKEIAPIRLKLLVAFAIMSGLTGLATIAPLLARPGVALIIGAVATGLAVVAGVAFRKAIADPYVATVVRMEGLADGDLGSPIEFVSYGDCVGRLTRAMLTFKDAAVVQSELNVRFDANSVIVRTMAENMRGLADGDLTVDVLHEFPAEYADLKTAFNDALGNLRRLIRGVTESAHGLRTGSEEIAQASEDLARRTESNAASLEETSAALVQIEGRVKATATASVSTVARADQAIASVGGGRATAEIAVQAMSRVSSSAKGIDSVIEGVDKIAFQTRVLAMNAAVEAGRAGDAGRGFAVVADLVSALALRAEEEAKRARDQLTVTQSEIRTAVEAVEKVDGAFVDIAGGVAAVHTLLAGMADDNLAQAAAITQINSAVGNMDKATQQNAAMVEETSAAARNLNAEVAALAEQTGQFRTEATTVQPAAPVAPMRQAAPIRKVVKAASRAVPKPAVKAYTNGHAAAANGDWADF